MASDNNSRQICKQAIIKLSLAYSFRKMFFIGQNLKHVHMTYSFLELLIFFWLTQVDIYSLKFISHHITEILYLETDQTPKETNHEIKTSIFTCFFHEIKTNIFTCFFNVKLKIPYEQSLFFLIFMNTFSEAAVLKQWCFSANLLIF